MSSKFTLGLCLALACVAIQAAPLSFQTKTIKAESCFLDKDKEKRCHENTVAYPITGDKHFDAWVKKSFNGKLPTQKSVKEELPDGEVQLVDDKGEVYDDLYIMDKVDTLELEGFSPNYAVFGHEYWTHNYGAAHGNGSHTLLVLPRNTTTPKELKLKDIVLPNQINKLIHLQREAIIKFFQEKHKMNEKEAREYFNEWNENKFQGTDNWRLGKNSIVFLFREYEVAAFSFGRPEIAIPIKDLQGIIKPEILRETEQYTPRPEKP